jgi:hypothetical protein
MGQITRPGTETLSLLPCSCCGGDIEVRDCALSSFNPGSAHCRGVCKRRWDLGYVDDRWDAGIRWNTRSAVTTMRLKARLLLTVSKCRDSLLQDEANRMLEELDEFIIGADK